MHVLDAGDVPLEQVVDHLLSNEGIRSLAGIENVVCFALARAELSQGFFEKLILNVDTIDYTTRQHIAFVVFYGSELSVVSRPHIDTNPLRFRVNGMSRSRPPYYERIFDRKAYDAQFDEKLAQKLRANPRKAPLKRIARVMEGVTDRMLQHLDIRERDLPCLLFVDKEDPRRHCVVRISPDRPMESLYEDVLAPLSDELRDLERIWRSISQWLTLDADVAYAQRTVNEKSPTVARLRTELADIKEKIATAIQLQKDTGGAWVAEFEALSQLRKSLSNVNSIDAKLSLIPSDHPLYQTAVEAQATLAELEARRRDFGEWSGLTDAEKSKRSELGSLTNRARSALSAVGDDFRKELNARYETRRHEFEALKKTPKNLEAEHASIVGELRTAETDLSRAHAKLAIDRDELKRYVEGAGRRFKQQGYPDDFVTAGSLPAFAVIDNMARRELIGFVKPTEKSVQKILFLASNPVDTSALDLEEELRTVELELAATDGRKKVALTAKHAVRPDDLVRHIRAEQPAIVHFSGHGTNNGIAVRGDDGKHRIVPAGALARLFAGRGVKLIVLNACFSMPQATALLQSVGTVVGTTAAVDDEAARRFSAAFYRTLGNGHSIAEAFRDGGDAVSLYSLDDVYHMIGDGSACPVS